MIGRLLAAATLAVTLTGTAMAQMAAPPSTNPPAPAGANGASPMGAPTKLNHQPAAASSAKSSLSGDRQTAQGRPPATPKLSVANQLNACESQPLNQRQACIKAATGK